MTTHDFARLSSFDFEELVRDLLQADLGVRLECFTAGRDSGIDLRCLSEQGATTIVQCKHMQGSSYSSLARQLRIHEAPKVQALKPKRYILATTLGLTPNNKAEIVKLFSPYLQGPHDILGRDDINNLLKIHPAVETSNFKLWLTSSDVLQRVLHNAEACQTEFEIERVCRKLPLFVQNEAYPRALKVLEDTRIAIISGIPGIGKTTLADMLLFTHLEQGYKPIVAMNKIEEARKLFDKNEKQIFYFDDFLGQTFLRDRPDLINQNQDASLISFMEAIRYSKASRFILTTREHILRTAIATSERLARSPILEHRCVIELHDYSYSQKARILYNHLYFSDLPLPYKEAVLQEDFYLKVVQHENFNPRIIEWLSGFIRVRQIEAEQYREHIAELLNSPEKIWSHAFEHQISEASRSLLLALFSTQRSTYIVDLEPVWRSIHRFRSHKYNFKSSASDFVKSLDEITGSFLSLRSDIVQFLNPSIRDFIESLLCKNQEHVRDIIGSAIRFDQIMGLRNLAKAHPNHAFAPALADNAELIAAVERVLYGPDIRWEKQPDASTRGMYVDASHEARLQILIEWAEEKKLEIILSVFLKFFQFVCEALHSIDIVPMIHVLNAIDKAPWVLKNGGEKLRRKYLDVVLEDLQLARHYEWHNVLQYERSCQTWTDQDAETVSKRLEKYRDSGISDESSECHTTSDLTEFKDGLKTLSADFGLGLDKSIRQIEYEIAEREEYSHSQDEEYHYRGPSVASGPNPFDEPNEDEIRHLFTKLVD